MGLELLHVVDVIRPFPEVIDKFPMILSNIKNFKPNANKQKLGKRPI